MGVVFEIIVEKIVSIVQEYSSRVYNKRRMGVVFEIIVEKIVSIVQEYSSRVYQRRIGVGFESIVKEYSQEDWEYIKDIDELNAEFSQFTAVYLCLCLYAFLFLYLLGLVCQMCALYHLAKIGDTSSRQCFLISAFLIHSLPFSPQSMQRIVLEGY